MPARKIPTLRDIKQAAARIDSVATRTPLIEAPSLSKRFGKQIYLKLECFQPTGAFKIRGAYNKISQLKQKNIIAASSGNHGIAVSYSCHLLGKKCTIVVPENAVEEKIRRIKDYGSKVVKFGKYADERAQKAHEISRRTGAVLVHPYDDPEVIAGQGTCGLEIASQLRDIDSVIFPVGGGGLISGSAIALKTTQPRARIFGVEPIGAPKLREALREGRPVSLKAPQSIADGLLPNSIGELAFQAAKRYVDGTFTVTDEQISTATKLMFTDAHVIAEPSGAAPLASLIAKQELEELGERIVLVVSGGNISLSLLAELLSN